jgi:hypothetical protein
MLKRNSATILMTFWLTLSTSPIGLGLSWSHRFQTSKVTGVVVAKSPHTDLMLIIGTSTSYFLQDILLRVEKDGGGFSKGQYLRLVFDNSSERQRRLPESMFKKGTQWEFTLTRKESCDSSIKDLLYTPEAKSRPLPLELVTWAKREELPLDAAVQCYEFKPGDYKQSE